MNKSFAYYFLSWLSEPCSPNLGAAETMFQAPVSLCREETSSSLYLHGCQPSSPGRLGMCSHEAHCLVAHPCTRASLYTSPYTLLL